MNRTRYTIVDVRSPMEFQGGHVAGSANIPLQKCQIRLKNLETWHSHSCFVAPAETEADRPQRFLIIMELSARMVEVGWK